jgi:hypothetical protein
MKTEVLLLAHAVGSGAGSVGSLVALRESDAYLFVLPLFVCVVFTLLDAYLIWKSVFRKSPDTAAKKRR